MDPGSPSTGGPGSSPGTCVTGCRNGFTCQAGACALDPTGRWVLTVTTGTVSQRDGSGSAWDFPGGLPDPFVCLTINGSRRCTATRDDTLSPVWNEAFPAATATALQVGVKAELVDEDVSSNDTICSGTLAVSTSDFQSGTWGVQCQGGLGEFSATLRAQ